MGSIEKHDKYENIYKKRFSFGKNWKIFLNSLDDRKINKGKESLLTFTDLKDFKKKTFLDIGCGSGLFSLCAVLLKAERVISMDVDDTSVECARYLRKKFCISEKKWLILKGSVLDKNFIKRLPQSDIVYSWGVLHHTGRMWEALENLIPLVKNKGLLYIAIYNKFNGLPISSKAWLKVKRAYSGKDKVARKAMEICYVAYYFAGLMANAKNPIKYVREYPSNSRRGMDFYTDARDWLGGYPYEFASVEEIKHFYKERKFRCINVKKTAREGCNEFLFRREK